MNRHPYFSPRLAAEWSARRPQAGQRPPARRTKAARLDRAKIAARLASFDAELAMLDLPTIEETPKQNVTRRLAELGVPPREPTIPLSRVAIPERSRVHGALCAFSGPDAERDAFVSGHFFLASLFERKGSAEFLRRHGLAPKGSMSTGDNTAGGFLVPAELHRAILRLRQANGVFPRFANSLPMGSDITNIPRLLSDVTAQWAGEEAGITDSDPGIGNAEMRARKIAALTLVSSELDEDAIIDIGDQIAFSIAAALADKIDQAAFNGDGTSQFGGTYGLASALHANAIAVAATGNDSVLTLDLADFEKTAGMLPAYARARPRWFMHPAVYYASAARLANAAGGNTNVTLADGASEVMFLGYPVTFVPAMPSTTGSLPAAIVAYFGDLRSARPTGLGGLRLDISRDRHFEKDMLAIRSAERLAIVIHERGETDRNRPIVALQTASS